MRNSKHFRGIFRVAAALIALLSLMLGTFYFFAQGAYAQSPQWKVASSDAPKFFEMQSSAATQAAAHSHSKLVDTIPYWSSLFAYNGLTYPFQMVGTDPTAGSATTTVPTEIIPLNLVFSDGTSFDGTGKVDATMDSPIFQKASYSSGRTQYGDAIQRAEFWKYVSSKSRNYHVLLSQPRVYSTVTLNVPASAGQVAANRHTGQPEGLVDINWFDPQIQSLIASLHLGLKTLPIFLDYNTFLYSGNPSQCCIIGYHNALPSTSANGQSQIQTYAFAAYNDPGMFSVPIEDVNALSHEIAEWYSDPFTDNVTPTWISPIAPQYGCNNFLEVGDPLVGVTFNVNGYHLQDEAFYSWFAKQSPSIGIHGQYTYLGTFTVPSPTC